MTYEIIHTTESIKKHCRIEKHWYNGKHHGNRFGSFFPYFSQEDSKTITSRPTRSDATTTIHEKTGNKVTETSTSPRKLMDYFQCRYHLTLFKMGLFGADHL